MKFFNVVLTSNNINKCIRAVNSFNDDVTVICNTLKNNYYDQLCEQKQLSSCNIIKTQSDGTVATGKQSVLHEFLKTDSDYLILVDGDDFLGPEGTKPIKDLLTTNPVDLVWGTETILFPNFDNFLSNDQYHLVNWQLISPEFLVLGQSSKNNMLRKHKVSALKLYRLIKEILGQEQYSWHRNICFSRKSAEILQFENSVGHEEFRAALQLKQHTYKKELSSCLLIHDMLYIYDQLDVNSQQGFATVFKNFNNIVDLKEALFNGFSEEDINQLKTFKLPQVTIPSYDISQYVKSRIL